MIENKKLFFISLVVLFMSILLNFPYPHRYPFGEVVFSSLHIPTKSSSGFLYVGILTIVLLIIGLYLLGKSLSKFQGRIGILTILIIFILPPIAVDTYQSSFASSIYALSYEAENSECKFEMVDNEMLQGECFLSFQNNSNKDVLFTVEFQEELIFKDDLPVVSLMNNDAPYEIKIGKKESKRVNIKSMIDVSQMEEHIEGGSAQGMDIKIKANGKEREL